jgi:hypothetical protein
MLIKDVEDALLITTDYLNHPVLTNEIGLKIKRATRHEIVSLTVWKDLMPNRTQESLPTH